jgi:hypothetical protein
VSVTFAATYYTYGRVYGPASNVYFGSDVASGDVDADGRNDIVVGANGDDSSSRGRVYVFSWGDGYEDSTVVATSASYAYFRGASNNDRLGASVGVADFNGDGYDDVVACASGRDGSGGATDAGACYVQRGSTTSYSASSIASSAVATITGTVANDGVGGTRHAVSTGDFDGDGTPDLAIGASGYDGYATNGGGVGIFDGGLLSGGVTFPTAQWLVRGDGALGISAALGDIDGDGIADLLAGATTAGGNKGVTYMIEGGIATGTYTVPADQFASWTGDSSGDLFGFSVGGFRDLDADGTPDVVVGAPFQDAGGTTNFGRVHVLSGY